MWIFMVQRGGERLGCLRDLNQLEGSLKILIDHDAEEESNAIEAREADLRMKTRLHRLKMVLEREGSMDVKEALEPPPNLLRLSLEGFGAEVPGWISTSLQNLKHLTLCKCWSWPPLGNLPCLENLKVDHMDGTEYLGHEFLRITDGGNEAFPKLKNLHFVRCYEWTEWEDITEEEENVVSIMPNLRTLTVHSCPSLKSLPLRLLRKMATLECLYICLSDHIVEQHRSGELADYLSPTCTVDIESMRATYR